jgi:hypothetical protein
MTARELIATLIIEIPRQLPGARAWRRNVGATVVADRFVRYGLPGESDVTGIIQPGGIRLEIEVKAGKDKPTPEQLSYLNMIRTAGGIGLICRDVNDTIAAIRAELETRK